MLWHHQDFGEYDDIIKWKHFPRYWPFVRGIHRSPVKSPHKGQPHGALMFSLICAWINGSVNPGEAGDLRRRYTHYDGIVMKMSCVTRGPFFSKMSLYYMMVPCICWFSIGAYEDGLTWNEAINIPYIILCLCYKWLPWLMSSCQLFPPVFSLQTWDCGFNPFNSEFILVSMKSIFSITSQYWNGTGSWNPACVRSGASYLPDLILWLLMFLQLGYNP